MLAAQNDAVDKVVDVRHVIQHATAADHAELPARDGAKQLQEPQVAGPVNADGPKDRAAQSAVDVLLDEQLTLELRCLINVARRERCVLVRRHRHVAVHADSAAVHDSRYTGAQRFIDDIAGSVDVDATIDLVAVLCFAIHRGDVINDVATGNGLPDAFTLDDVAAYELNALCRERRCLTLITYQRHDLVAATP